jgi:rubrerythrin
VNELKAIPPILTNLAKAAEKQLNQDRSKEFQTLAKSFSETTKLPAHLVSIEKSLQEKLQNKYPPVQEKAAAVGDRGVLRAYTWGKKVTSIQKSLIHRYSQTGEALLEDQNLYICEACGFISLGKKTPDICPICKAPKKRFLQVK